MDISISITDSRKLLGLQRALAAQNATGSTPLSMSEFVQELVTDLCAGFAQLHLTTQMDPFTWLKTRFTAQERAAIRAAALTSGAVADLCAMTDRADMIHFDDPLTIAGVAQLEAAGLLAPGRGAEILAL